MKTCPQCQTSLEDATRECPCCAHAFPPVPRAVARAGLRSCPACGRGVSPAAKGCPQCGEPFIRRMSSGRKWGIATLVLAGLLIWWSEAVHESKENLRKMQRDADHVLRDIDAGTYHPPVEVRIVK